MSTMSKKLKEGVRFELVYREHQDPLYADTSAPERVLVPIMPHRRRRRRTTASDVELVNDVESIYSGSSTRTSSTMRSMASAQSASTYKSSASRMSKSSKASGRSASTTASRKYDVVSIIDDNYDYNKHYRDIGGGVYIPADPNAPFLPAAEDDVAIEIVRGSKIFRDIPKDVFGTASIETEPRLSLFQEMLQGGPAMDPDIMAALDAGDDEQYEELEDDFVQLANGAPIGEEEHDGEPIDDSELFPDDEEEGEEGADGEERASESRPRPKAPAKNNLKRWQDSDEEEDEDEEGEEEGEWEDEDEEDEKRSNKQTSSRPLTALEQEFEDVLREYDDDEIGELDAYADDDTLRGTVELSQVTGVLNQFLTQQAKRTFKDLDNDAPSHNGVIEDRPVPLSKFENELLEQLDRADPENDTVLNYGSEFRANLDDPELRRRMAQQAPVGMKLLDSHKRDSDVTKKEVVAIVRKMLEREAENPQPKQEFEYIDDEPDKEHWDCESIVSTYSNVENHPILIKEASNGRRRKNNTTTAADYDALQQQQQQQKLEPKQIQLSKKSGLPIGILSTRAKGVPATTATTAATTAVTAAATVADSDDDDDSERVNLGEGRPKEETAEERRERKKAVKAEKKVKREQKKMVKGIYKSEELSQRKLQSQLGIQKNTVLKL